VQVLADCPAGSLGRMKLTISLKFSGPCCFVVLGSVGAGGAGWIFLKWALEVTDVDEVESIGRSVSSERPRPCPFPDQVWRTDQSARGSGHGRYTVSFCAGPYRRWLSLSIMPAIQPPAIVRHARFYIDDRKPFVTLLVNFALLCTPTSNT
jgi:hypothetical protein